jgi:serine/threonine-protein kinase
VTGAHALPAGLRLGDYEIVSPLTSGGMAAVYLGRRMNGGGYVAIKVVHPRYAGDPAFVSMFLDEARLSVRIQHPNVVRVEATGEAGGLYYMVMEYLHGAPLQRFVFQLAKQKRVLVHEVAVYVIASVAAGMHAAHEAVDEAGRPLGIVHRDVTPQNILVTFDGRVKLIDFGIAKAAGRIHETAKGMLKGKVRFMAPEQAAGRAVDRRTDVYALALVLWELLTYKKAFAAKTDAELFRLVLMPKLVPPSKLNANVAHELDHVVMTALAPNPDERFQTALAFQNALLGALPMARRVDAAQLSALVSGVLADQLASDARALPASVVISQPRAIGVVDEGLTQVVPSLVPDEEDEPARPSPAPAPPPRVAPVVSTVYGVGLSAPAPVAPPAPIAPTPPAPSPIAPPIASTRLALRAQAPAAPRASFTSPDGPRSSTPTPTPPAPSSSSVTSMLAIGCGMLVTIAIGIALGWLALHHATGMLAP